MKTVVVLLFLITSNVLVSQDKSIDDWIQDIVNDMIEMNDLDKYSSEEISPDINVNFIMVESVKDITIAGNQISMLVNHGKGTYCTKITFEYIEENGEFFLIFSESEAKVTLGKERKWVNPWIEKKDICD